MWQVYLTGVRLAVWGGCSWRNIAATAAYFFPDFNFLAICSISLGFSSARTLSTILERDSPSSEESSDSSTEGADESTDPPCPSDKGGAPPPGERSTSNSLAS